MSKHYSNDTICRFTRENLHDLCKFLIQVVEICSEEGVTMLGTSLIEEFDEKIDEYDMHRYLTQFTEASLDKETNTFKIWNKLAVRDEAHFKTNLLGMIQEDYRENFGPFMDLLDAKDSDGNFIINDEYKDAMWEFGTSLSKFSFRFVHNSKEPFFLKNNGKMEKSYGGKKFIDIEIKEMIRVSELFKIELKW